MTRSAQCKFCGLEFPISEPCCPHCARPGLFPNVSMAELDEEREALDKRYDEAVEDAEQRGCSAVVQAFEAAAAGSAAVINRSLGETERLASGTNQLYGTFYQQLEAGLRIPEGSDWDELRQYADQMLFGTYKTEVRFGALSLDGLGLEHYGECTWVLKEDMISHRASVFEENSVIFLKKRNISPWKGDQPPAGFRASWNERAKLCVAKVASEIDKQTSDRAFPGLLMRRGATPEADVFVEVHIGGPMTIKTTQRVIVSQKIRRTARGRALRKKLEALAVDLEGRA